MIVAINATIIALMLHLGEFVLSAMGQMSIIVDLWFVNERGVHGTIGAFDTPYLAIPYKKSILYIIRVTWRLDISSVSNVLSLQFVERTRGTDRWFLAMIFFLTIIINFP